MYRFVVKLQPNDGPNCTAERVAGLCIGLYNRVQLYGVPNCTAEREALLCIGLWYRYS